MKFWGFLRNFSGGQWQIWPVHAASLRKSIGKPRILVIVRDAAQFDMLRDGPFGTLFMDLFDPRGVHDGGGILIAGDDELSEGRIMQALSRIRPMCLLC